MTPFPPPIDGIPVPNAGPYGGPGSWVATGLSIENERGTSLGLEEALARTWAGTGQSIENERVK